MKKSENVPLYFRIYHNLKKDIISGKIEKGVKFDNFVDLAKKYKVSQASMRKSLDILESEGLLEKKPGIGIFVPETADLEPIDLAELFRSKQTSQTIKNSEVTILSAEWIKPPAKLTQFYGLEKNVKENSLYKIFYKTIVNNDKRIVLLLTLYFSKFVMRGIHADFDEDPYDIVLKLSDFGDSHPVEISNSFRPSLCMGQESELLGLPDGTPIFSQEMMFRFPDFFNFFVEIISTANIHTHKEILK